MMNSISCNKCHADSLVMPTTKFPSETPLGIAYVPYQSWEEPYAENVALAKGTIFPSLDFPFLGKGGAEKYGK